MPGQALPVACFDAGHGLRIGAAVEEGELATSWQGRGPVVHLAQHVAHECLLPPAADQHLLHSQSDSDVNIMGWTRAEIYNTGCCVPHTANIEDTVL